MYNTDRQDSLGCFSKGISQYLCMTANPDLSQWKSQAVLNRRNGKYVIEAA